MNNKLFVIFKQNLRNRLILMEHFFFFFFTNTYSKYESCIKRNHVKNGILIFVRNF